MKALPPLLSLALLAVTPLLAETVKDREGAVRADRTSLGASARWNYDDVDAGFALAGKTGKPLLVVLRCIPCLACMGIDASVVAEDHLASLLDQFVCVRVINANSLDLSRFQFDYDLSFSALVFHADGTVIGRYGSWQHQKDPHEKSVAGFRRTLEAALALHRAYPGNRVALAGKQGGPVPYRTPVDFPTLSGKYASKLDWDGKVVQSCVHCHMVGDAFRAEYRSRGEAVPEPWIYPHPPTEILGLSLAPEEVATVQEVLPASPAARAGLAIGDRLLSLDGQALISSADARWALHRAPDSGALIAEVARGTARKRLEIELAPGWRTAADIGRRVGTWPMRAMAFGGMKMDDLTDGERAGLGLGNESLALRIAHVGQYGPHAAAKKEGFLRGDIILAVGEWRERTTESTLIGRLLQRHRPGEKLPALVLRNGTRLPLSLPQQ